MPSPWVQRLPAEVIWRARPGEPAHAFGIGPGDWRFSVCGALRWTMLVKPPTDPARCPDCNRALGLIT